MYYNFDIANISWNSASINLTQTETVLKEPIDLDFEIGSQRVFVFVRVFGYTGGSFKQVKQIYKGVKFSKEFAGKNWTEKDLHSGDKEVYLSIRYRLLECDDCNFCRTDYGSCQKCVDNYYPAGQCTKFCEPETNRYSCTSEGGINCLKNREGDKCEKCAENFYGENCSKFCQESQNFSCSDEGDKVCAAHFYPEDNCSTFCSPVEDHYTCDNITGDKLCAPHFFGDDCSVYCKPNEYYTCSEEGDMICRNEKANPEKNCVRSHLLLVAGIGGGLAFTGILVFITLLVCRLNKNQSKRAMSDTQDDIYETLDTPPQSDGMKLSPPEYVDSPIGRNTSMQINEIGSKLGKQSLTHNADACSSLKKNIDAVYSTLHKENDPSEIEEVMMPTQNNYHYSSLQKRRKNDNISPLVAADPAYSTLDRNDKTSSITETGDTDQAAYSTLQRNKAGDGEMLKFPHRGPPRERDDLYTDVGCENDAPLYSIVDKARK